MKKRFITITVSVVFIVLLCLSGFSREIVNYLENALAEDLSFDLKEEEKIVGVWIASISNIDFPSAKGLDEQTLKNEIDEIVELCSEMGINTIFFQVRPASDALYNSSIFPLSTYLTGGEQRMFSDGDFDALEYMIDQAHTNGIRVHAWINPMRITSGTSERPSLSLDELCDTHPAVLATHTVIRSSNGCMYYDIGYPEARELIASGVKEIAEGYEVDGIVFDDYFYPYNNATFDDSASYALYSDELSLEDFRRANVTELMRLCSEAVMNTNNEILFGISPFGIWQNDTDSEKGSATKGTSSYHNIFCDTLALAENGYVDYVAPQLYWNDDDESAPYNVLCEWWAKALKKTGTALVVSHAAYKYDGTWKSPLGTITKQYYYARNFSNYRGSIFYGFNDIKKNTNGLRIEVSLIGSTQNEIKITKDE